MAEMPVTCLLKISEMLCQIPSRSGRKKLLFVVISKVVCFPRHGTCDEPLFICCLFVVNRRLLVVFS